MPKGIPKNGINIGRFKKGVKPLHSFAKGHKIRLGIKHTNESKNKNRASHLGKKASEETRKKMSLARTGEKSYYWRGGITPINKRIRKSEQYKLWRIAVFKRDNYICVWCGVMGGKLNADHIKPFSLFPELHFAIDNGRTLCESCHRKTDTFGARIRIINKD